MQRLLTSAALLLALSLPTAAHAWTAFGHRLVALLAYDQLSPAAKAQVDGLLVLEPGADIGTIASWADEVRRTPGFEDTGPLHYVNFSYRSCSYAPARDCRDGMCVVGALERYSAALADRALPREKRLEALKFVVHFAGDIHQPMHAGNRDDRGGNRFQVKVKGKGSNLHAVWDHDLLQSAGLNLAAYRARLAPQVASAAIAPMDFTAWALESCRLLDDEGVYPKRPGKLSNAYLDAHRPLAEARVVLAAARLAALLESRLGAVANQEPARRLF